MRDVELRGPLAIIALVICLGAGIGIGYGISAAVAPVKPVGLTGTIRIGGLIELTGDLGPWGPMYEAALELAESDVNAWLEEIGAGFKIKIVIEDIASNPDVCLEKVKALHAQGIKFFVGPTSSGELSAIFEYVNSNHLLVISHASTAITLAKPGDFVFRACPNDAAQGPAIARMVYDTGVRHLVILHRQDDWGVGLKDAVSEAFKKLGGKVEAVIPYTEKAEYGTEAATLNDKVEAAISAAGGDKAKVGVLAISFGEIASIVLACKGYDILSQVKWFGCDGFVMCTDLLKPEVVDFVLATGMVCTVFAPSRSPKFTHVREYIYSKVGEEPDAYAYPLYDAVWLIVHSLMHVGAYDPDAVRKVLPKIAENYFGATGWMKLNEAGDKEASDYDLCAVVEVDGEYTWDYVGKWIYTTDTIVWTTPIYS